MVVTVGEGVLEVALNVVREVRSALEEVAVREPEPWAPDPLRRPPPARSEPGLFDRTSKRDAPPRAADAPARPASPTPPPVPDEVKTLDDEPVLVAEFGEAGAEENAGAQVSVGEPWDGYDRMNVQAVKDRLAEADREVLGAVMLYEGFGKKRSSVAQAAERHLTRLSRPGSS